MSWLLPAALILLIGGLVLLRGVPRTDRTRAALLIWGGWLVVTGLTFSLAAGIIHPYYTVALAPAIGAVVAVAGRLLWQQRARTWVRRLLTVVLVGTSAWSWVLLDRVAWYQPWLRWVVTAAGVAAAVVLLRPAWGRRRVAVAATAAAAVALLAGPVAFSWCTVTWPHHGALPTAGPQRSPVIMGSTTIVTTPSDGTTAQGTTANGSGVVVTGAPPEQSGLGPLATPRATGPGGLFAGLPVASWGAMGNLLIDPAHVTTGVRKLLDENASSYSWVGATLGSENAAGFQLASGHPVLPLGGFNASDPFPTFAQFRADVAAHRVHWFIGGGATEPSASGSDVAHQIAAWVVAHYHEQVVDGVVLYDLSRPPA